MCSYDLCANLRVVVKKDEGFILAKLHRNLLVHIILCQIWLSRFLEWREWKALANLCYANTTFEEKSESVRRYPHLQYIINHV